MTLSLVRVVYEPDSRSVVLLTRRLPLLRFAAPEYELGPDHGSVTWRIERGVLVAREGRDQAASCGSRSHRPQPAGRRRRRGDPRRAARGAQLLPLAARLGALRALRRLALRQTQLRIHVLVCNGFLRSLAALDLPPSRVGSLAGEIVDRGVGAAK